MRDTDPLNLALGLSAPWGVARATFDAQARRLDIDLDRGAGGCPVHDTGSKSWRHLNVVTARSHYSFASFGSPVCRRYRLFPQIVRHLRGFKTAYYFAIYRNDLM